MSGNFRLMDLCDRCVLLALLIDCTIILSVTDLLTSFDKTSLQQKLLTVTPKQSLLFCNETSLAVSSQAIFMCTLTYTEPRASLLKTTPPTVFHQRR